MRKTKYFIVAAFLYAGCSRNEATNATGAESEKRTPGAAARTSPLADSESSQPSNEEQKLAPQGPTIGQRAPEFTLRDLEGTSISLKEHRGKLVVLEWFNPECPFVRAAHTEGSLVDTAKKLTERGVVYLAINSGASKKQGHGKEVNLAGKERFGLTHPILLDEEGTVGRAYGATNTPHIYVIDREGRLAYAGAVDNSPDGEGKSPKDGKLVNYLMQAVEEIEAGKPVSVPVTKAYGCSVKYGI